MIAEFFISFREALEAALVVGIVLAYLERTGNSRFNRHVYLGVAAGVLASVIAAFAFQTIAGGFEGRGEKIFEGTLMVAAAVLVSWMVLWMMRQEHVRSEIEDKVRKEMSGGAALGLVFFTFLSVFREGVETVIFVSAAAGTGGEYTLFGVLAGLAAAVVLAFVVFETAVKVNVKRFFNATSLVLVVFAAGIFAHGVHEFQEAGILREQDELWSTKSILSDESALGSILRTLTGYNDNPTPFEVLAYAGYLTVIALAYRNIDRLHRII